MSLGNDFKKIIDKLWDIERFDMCMPDNHGGLAYVLDRTYESERYSQIYNRLLALANDDTANEFAMYVCELSIELAREDASYDKEDLKLTEGYFDVSKEMYEKGTIFIFGIVHENYYPDWFYVLFGSYIPLERMKRELAVKNALEENGYSKEQAELLYSKLLEQDDILRELYYYVKTGKMSTFSPCTAKKLSAQHLRETICKNPIEAYLYLVYLREYPEQALAEYKMKMSDKKT